MVRFIFPQKSNTQFYSRELKSLKESNERLLKENEVLKKRAAKEPSDDVMNIDSSAEKDKRPAKKRSRSEWPEEPPRTAITRSKSMTSRSLERDLTSPSSKRFKHSSQPAAQTIISPGRRTLSHSSSATATTSVQTIVLPPYSISHQLREREDISHLFTLPRGAFQTLLKEDMRRDSVLAPYLEEIQSSLSLVHRESSSFSYLLPSVYEMVSVGVTLPELKNYVLSFVLSLFSPYSMRKTVLPSYLSSSPSSVHSSSRARSYFSSSRITTSLNHPTGEQTNKLREQLFPSASFHYISLVNLLLPLQNPSEPDDFDLFHLFQVLFSDWSFAFLEESFMKNNNIPRDLYQALTKTKDLLIALIHTKNSSMHIALDSERPLNAVLFLRILLRSASIHLPSSLLMNR